MCGGAQYFGCSLGRVGHSRLGTAVGVSGCDWSERASDASNSLVCVSCRCLVTCCRGMCKEAESDRFFDGEMK